MDKVKDLFSIGNIYHTPKGLTLSTCYLLIIFIGFLKLISGVVMISGLNLTVFVGILITLTLSNFIIWMAVVNLRSIPLTKVNKINIAFAVDVNEKEEELYKKIIISLSRKLNNIDKYNNFAVIELRGINIKNAAQAEKYSKDEKINLIIWGNAEEGKEHGKNTTNFNLNFSYNFNIPHRSVEEKEEKKRIFSSNIQESIKGRSWKISEDESLPQMKVVADNVTEVTLYIVTKCLSTFGFVRLAYEYCEELLSSITEKTAITFVNYYQFKEIVKKTLLTVTLNYASFCSTKKLHQKAIELSNRALELDPNNYSGVTIAAINNWLIGEKKIAYVLSERASKINPSNNINRFNRAFFALDRNDFIKALSMYKKIEIIPPETDILPIIEFLENEYDKSNNIAMIYGAGYLNLAFADRIRGRKQLRYFLNKTKDNNKTFKVLIDESKILLK